jgi:hypothetical protein
MTDFSQPGIFNALHYGMSPTNYGTDNAAALQAAINAAQISGNPNGAIVLIPSFALNSEGAPVYGDYNIEASSGPAITIPETDEASPLLIMGTGPGTTLVMQTPGSTLFSVDSAFTTFQDLTVVDAAADETAAGIAFDFGTGNGNQCNKVLRVSIIDFPQAIVVENKVLAGTQHARLLECFIDYGGSLTLAASAAVQIVGGSEDTVISQSIFRWHAGTQVESNYGVFVDGASNVKVSDTQITGLGTGIQIQGSTAATSEVRVNGCDFFGPVGSCAVINPTASDICFTNCHFQAGGTYTGTKPGIAIGMDGGTNAEIDTVRFISCSLTGNSGMGPGDTYGLSIGVGQNIQICGGYYSGNGATAGIAIVGGATQVQIIGANCIGLEYEGGHDSTPLYQLYGILITNGSGIQIVGVNCSGNGQPVDSGGSPGDGIHIDGSDATVSDVRMIGAVCTGVLGDTDITQQTGIFVKEAQGVLVKDCTLSGSTGDSGYGLYLEAASDVTVKACDLYGNVQGLRIDTDSTRVYVRDCNATGYSSYLDAISIASSLSDVEVTNCGGYNDKHTLLTSIAPTGTFSGVSVLKLLRANRVLRYAFQRHDRRLRDAALVGRLHAGTRRDRAGG